MLCTIHSSSRKARPPLDAPIWPCALISGVLCAQTTYHRPQRAFEPRNDLPLLLLQPKVSNVVCELRKMSRRREELTALARLNELSVEVWRERAVEGGPENVRETDVRADVRRGTEASIRPQRRREQQLDLHHVQIVPFLVPISSDSESGGEQTIRTNNQSSISVSTKSISTR